MAYHTQTACRKFRFIIAGLLLFQFCSAQKTFKKVDKWLEDNAAQMGGRAVLMIWKDGQIVYSKVENDLSRRQKMIGKFVAKKTGKDADELIQDYTTTTKERIASCSKWLSAATVMSFADEGKLSLDDSVGKFLPVMTANGKGGIKLWQCLSHLTGIKQTGVMATAKAGDGDEETTGSSLRGRLQQRKDAGNTNKFEGKWSSMDAAIDSIAHQPMEGEPGKTFHYGNAGLQIAAAVIEKISGKDFKTLFAERIGIPCEMSATDWGPNKVPLAAGGAFSTPEDYLKFLTMILAEGKYKGKQVLSKASVIQMQLNRVSEDCNIVSSPAEAGNWGYGFGEWVMDDATGNTRSKAVTSPGLFGSFPWVDNEKKYCAILFTFYIKNKGRNERYKELKQLVDEALERK